METNEIMLGSYRRCEYMLVINPNEALQHKIMHVKNEFHEKFKTALPPTKPHITLVKFFTWEAMEEKLAQHLHIIAMGTAPFKMELKDYASFPAHTIYINITTKNAIHNLVKELREARRLMKSPDHDPHFIMDPHMTVAYKLLPWQYEKGWLEYSHRHFTGSFIADNMLLLKRHEDQRRYQIVQRFDFQNLPVSTKQGELFA
jgi:2'-5' RNA ligase